MMKRSLLAYACLAVIRAYRFVFSGRPSPCRFDPTCSQYGLDAVSEYGAVKGLAFTARRIVRCRPGGGMGYDPIPARSLSKKASHV
jgi:uncharacterized protein